MTEGDVPRDFEKPEVTDLGNLVDLTSMMADGTHTDATFPAGTPRGDLTFS